MLFLKSYTDLIVLFVMVKLGYKIRLHGRINKKGVVFLWYENCFRRHLCDIHINEWDESFLSRFSPEEYLANLKRAKIQNAMIYFQSHSGLCYYPTKSGKMHNAFRGKEDSMSRLTKLCHDEGISVTGYYSVIYNTWAHDKYPEWRMIDETGISTRVSKSGLPTAEFSDRTKDARYGLCCPNNSEYREFLSEQIKELAQYVSLDGMFYDMMFWPHLCYCDSCKKRWAKEVGGEIPITEDWSDERWLLHIRKRREWIGEFAHMVTDLTKSLFPGISVEYNMAFSALPNGITSNCEEVMSACDFAGGDLYRGIYSHSFACKFYRNITKNQPFEYMFSRCAPNLTAHTHIKSRDIMRSDIFLTAANHGATLVIDAIDPVGTMDSRVYSRIGEVFDELIPYEPYLVGEAVEEIGVYYSLKSKFNAYGEPYTNYLGATNAVEALISENIMCGVTGGFHDINKYKLLVAPMLTGEDAYDNRRIMEYVKEGGCIYFTGAENSELIKEFFGGEPCGRTKERVVYIAPKERAEQSFLYFNAEHPLNYTASVPIVKGIDEEKVIATITLPYTHQDTVEFASIHSDPPGIKTDIPAMAVTSYGKGKVLWSAALVEGMPLYEYKIIFVNLLKDFLGFKSSVVSDAPRDVEITLFKTENSVLLNTVLLNTEYKARVAEDFSVNITCDQKPKKVFLLPDMKEFPCTIDENTVTVNSKNMDIFNMYKIVF